MMSWAIEILKRRPVWEAIVLAVLGIAFWVLCVQVDLAENIIEFLEGAEDYEADEILLVALFLGFGSVIYGVRRNTELRLDVEAQERSASELKWTAQHDALTGLPNRLYLQELIDKANIDDPKNTNPNASVLLVDIDNFKSINDLLLHVGGDELLAIISYRLKDAFPQYELMRVGGDEFLFLLDDTTPEQALVLANSVIGILSSPVKISGVKIEVGASIGVAHYPTDTTNLAGCIRCADIALYEAKRNTKGSAVRFNKKMHEPIVKRATIEQALRSAIRNGEFTVHYQPYFHARTQKIVGFEALARWPQADGTMIPPSQFIEVAEQSGAIFELSDYLFRQACADAKDWASEITLSFNISGEQLQDKLLGQRILRMLDQAGLSPHRLELEFTESCFVSDQEAAMITLKELREAGVRVALDDLGTGYSSFLRLSKLEFDKIKIDRQFVDEMNDDPRMMKIVAAMVSMGKNLEVEVVAEGVEDETQLTQLRILGCDLVQGFLWGRPVDATTAIQVLSGQMEEAGSLSDNLGQHTQPLSIQ